MSNCDPICLITDQDPAMNNAIEKVFDEEKTKHRLCMWHIMKKLSYKTISGSNICFKFDILGFQLSIEMCQRQEL
ncbi:Protein FAR1-RELATED SEQUENCE 5 [Bienertia sinuspersici]